MKADEKRAVLWDALDTVFNRKDPEGARRLHSPDYVGHVSYLPEAVDLDGLVAEGKSLIAGWPDTSVVFEDSFGDEDGDRFVARVRYSGNHLGEWMGIPPTGKWATVTGTVIARFADGLIAEEWHQLDTLGLLTQLGVVPAMA